MIRLFFKLTIGACNLMLIGVVLFYVVKIAYPELKLPTFDNRKVVNKIQAVKDKAFDEGMEAFIQEPIDKLKYTFFDALNDPKLVKYIGLDGKVKDKPITRVAQTQPQKITPPLNEPLVEKEKRDSKSPVSIAKVLEVLNSLAKKKKDNGVPQEKPLVTSSNRTSGPKGSFAVQVSSFQDIRRARDLESRLRLKGYDAFVSSAKISGSGTWYRVYLGRYSGKESAQNAILKARAVDRLNGMVVRID